MKIKLGSTGLKTLEWPVMNALKRIPIWYDIQDRFLCQWWIGTQEYNWIDPLSDDLPITRKDVDFLRCSSYINR